MVWSGKQLHGAISRSACQADQSQQWAPHPWWSTRSWGCAADSWWSTHSWGNTDCWKAGEQDEDQNDKFWKQDCCKADDQDEDDSSRGASDDERPIDEQYDEPCSWEHCVAPPEQKTDSTPFDEEEFRAIHEAALKQFYDDCDDFLGLDTEVVPTAAPAEARETEVIAIHEELIDVVRCGTCTTCAFYNPTTGGVDCSLCGMHLNSLIQWKDHRIGKKHVKNVWADKKKLTFQ